MDPVSVYKERAFAKVIAIICATIAFFLFVGVVGTDRSIDTSTTVVSTLEESITIPSFEQSIAPQSMTQNTLTTALHVATPDPLRGIYLTGWTAGTPSRLAKALMLFEGSSILNAVVIDIKDATGRLSYQPLDGELVAIGVGTNRIKDLAGLIDTFHRRGIYVIGRLTVFQDPFYAAAYPGEAFTDTRTGLMWRDYKGIAWLRPDSVAVAKYTTTIARDAYAQGFDEINLDYVRFPSDGELKYIDLSTFTKNKAETMQDFFRTMRTELASIPLSADVFGLTMSARDDVGIGQKAALIAPEVDALAPMLYPSHFWNGTYGIAVPAQEPYKVIYKSLIDGVAKLGAAGIDKTKLRPWFQDFDLVGVPYDAAMVRAQIQAAADLGIYSWMMWDPHNDYTDEVYKLEPEVGLEPTTTRLQNGSSTN
jgi:hypothetical protein